MAVQRVLLSAAIALLTLAAATAAQATTPNASTVDSIFSSKNFTGVGTIFMNGARVYGQGFGYQDFRYTEPMTTASRFRIGSNTKLYTAIALWQLHERGLINMTTDIASYLDPNDYAAFGVNGPYCPNQGDGVCQTITFVDLLGMTSCIPNSAAGELMPYNSVASIIGNYYFFSQLVCAPGSGHYYYSNGAFVWATYFIEKLTGMSYGSYVKQFITDPLGLRDTYFEPYDRELGVDWNRTEEYIQYLDPASKVEVTRGRCSAELNLGAINGAGGMISTVDDEATFWYKLFNFTSATSPLFLHTHTMRALLAPHVQVQVWNATHNQYYTQGLTVLATNLSQVIPNLILYEGGLMCTTTANLMFIPGARADAPKTMIQAWTSAPAYYATSAQLRQAVELEKGSIFNILAKFKRPFTDPATMAWQVAALLGFPE